MNNEYEDSGVAECRTSPAASVRCPQTRSTGNAASLLVPKPALAEPEPEPGAAVGDLTFHGELLHGAALSTGAVRGQRVALDAAASAYAAAQHVVGVQVVAALGSDGVSGKADLASPGLKNPVGGALTPGALSLTANLPGCPQPSRVFPMSSRISPLPPGSPQGPLDLP